jgi:hypothetical protein
MKKFEQNLIKLASKLELKYLIAKYEMRSSDDMKTTIINAALSGHFPNVPKVRGVNFIEALKNDSITIRVDIENIHKGDAKVDFTFADTVPQNIRDKYIPEIPKSIETYLKFKLVSEDGKWDFKLP